MQVKASAGQIVKDAIKLKPSGTVEGAYNTIDEELKAVENLKARLERRADYLVSLGNALANPAEGVITNDLETALLPLKTTVIELGQLINPVIEPLKKFAQKVREQNDLLRDAIKAFITNNSSKLESTEIPHGFGAAAAEV